MDRTDQATEQGFTRAVLSGSRHSTSFELVFSPMILALLGYWLDGRFGIRPVLTVVFAVLGVVGAAYTVVLRYRADMAAAEARAPWSAAVTEEAA